MRATEYGELRAFVVIAERGSFARAAEELRISPSTISEMLRNLERRLGVRLVRRTTRSVSLTEAGAQLLARVRPAFAEIDGAVEGLNEHRDKPAGVVRLLTPRLAAEMYLEPVLGRFREAYPDVVLDITVDDAVRDIVAEGFDVGIRLGELLERDVIAVKLGGDLRQVAFASPAYLVRHGRPSAPADLHVHRCINWRQPGSAGIYRWEFFRDGEWFAVAVDGPLVVSDRRFAISAAVQGVGVGFWGLERIRPQIESGRLVALLEDWSAPFPGFYLYYPTRHLNPAPLRALVSFLREGSSG